MTRLYIRDRAPQPGDVIIACLPPCEELGLPHPTFHIHEVVQWIHDPETGRCGLEFRYLPEAWQDQELAGEVVSIGHRAGRPFLHDGWYVSRADGGSVTA